MIVYTMPKSRIMSAGTVGTSKRIRVNGPEGGGNKLQGLPPICNMRSPLVPFVRTRADGENRNVVFCINQLSGGVGAKRGQFGPGNRAGVGQTGGCAKPTPPWWYNNQAIIAAVALLNGFIQTQTKNDAWLGFIGDHETIKSDYIEQAPEYIASPNAGYEKWLFEPFIGSHISQTASNKVMAAAALLNSMQIRAGVNGKYMLHEVGIIGSSVPASTPDHGLDLALADRLSLGLSDRLIIGVFGDICGSADDGSDATCDKQTGANGPPFMDIGCGTGSNKCVKADGIDPGSGWCQFNGTIQDVTDDTWINLCVCSEC